VAGANIQGGKTSFVRKTFCWSAFDRHSFDGTEQGIFTKGKGFVQLTSLR
jgi:hypothetical protein